MQSFTFHSIDEFKSTVRELLEEHFSAVSNSSEKQSPQQDYLTRSQTCKRLGGISYPTLGEYTKSGIIKAHRIGRRVLYSPADIDAALTAIKTTNNAGGVAA